jgi:hypothetical protein
VVGVFCPPHPKIFPYGKVSHFFLAVLLRYLRGLWTQNFIDIGR